jgi:hypothetical protein
MATIRILAIVTLVALVTIIVLSLDPAFAQNARPVPVPTTRGAPGPIAGAGLVATVLLGGAGYWLFRRFRKS